MCRTCMVYCGVFMEIEDGCVVSLIAYFPLNTGLRLSIHHAVEPST
jgi:hypothetical protein